MIPAIGPVIAGGSLATIVANAAGGTILATVVGALVGLGMPEEVARRYERAFESGRTLVTVQADERGHEAEAILQRHGGQDMQQVAR